MRAHRSRLRAGEKVIEIVIHRHIGTVTGRAGPPRPDRGPRQQARHRFAPQRREARASLATHVPEEELAARAGRARRARTLLLPFPPGRRTARLTQLYTGLLLFGLSSSLLVRGRHGLVPWDVLHQGLARHTGIALGTWAIIVSIAVLGLWIPLRERPGLGTISNAVLVGAMIDVVLALVPELHGSLARWACTLGGVVLNGVATGLYIGAGLGPGPRDGLMTGLARRTGYSLRIVRAAIEATVLCAGWLIGGTVGIGTLVYLAAIGPLAHLFIPLFTLDRPAARAGEDRPGRTNS